jgi:hypothetical protein
MSLTHGNNEVTLSWPETSTGFALESSSSLAAGSWNAVAGVANNKVTVPSTGALFFRLRK